MAANIGETRVRGELRSTIGAWWREMTAVRWPSARRHRHPVRCAWCEEWITVVQGGASTGVVEVSHGLCSRCHERLTRGCGVREAAPHERARKAAAMDATRIRAQPRSEAGPGCSPCMSQAQSALSAGSMRSSKDASKAGVRRMPRVMAT